MKKKKKSNNMAAKATKIYQKMESKRFLSIEEIFIEQEKCFIIIIKSIFVQKIWLLYQEKYKDFLISELGSNF